MTIDPNVLQDVAEAEPVPSPADNLPDSGTEQTTETTEQAIEPTAEGEQPEETSQVETKPKSKDPIARLTREKWDARREAEKALWEKTAAERERDALKAMLEAMQRGEKVETPEKPTTPTSQDIQREAQKLIADREFNEACNRTAEIGEKEIPNFKEAIEGFSLVAGQNMRRDFLEAVTALPNGHQVYYQIGTNLDEAARILSLPPVKMAIELAKISQDIAKPKPVPISNAPKPISVVEGTARAQPALEKMSDDEFDKEFFTRFNAKKGRV